MLTPWAVAQMMPNRHSFEYAAFMISWAEFNPWLYISLGENLTPAARDKAAKKERKNNMDVVTGALMRVSRLEKKKK